MRPMSIDEVQQIERSAYELGYRAGYCAAVEDARQTWKTGADRPPDRSGKVGSVNEK